MSFGFHFQEKFFYAVILSVWILVTNSFYFLFSARESQDFGRDTWGSKPLVSTTLQDSKVAKWLCWFPHVLGGFWQCWFPQELGGLWLQDEEHTLISTGLIPLHSPRLMGFLGLLLLTTYLYVDLRLNSEKIDRSPYSVWFLVCCSENKKDKSLNSVCFLVCCWLLLWKPFSRSKTQFWKREDKSLNSVITDAHRDDHNWTLSQRSSLLTS